MLIPACRIATVAVVLVACSSQEPDNRAREALGAWDFRAVHAERVTIDPTGSSCAIDPRRPVARCVTDTLRLDVTAGVVYLDSLYERADDLGNRFTMAYGRLSVSATHYEGDADRLGICSGRPIACWDSLGRKSSVSPIAFGLTAPGISVDGSTVMIGLQLIGGAVGSQVNLSSSVELKPPYAHGYYSTVPSMTGGHEFTTEITRR